MARGSTGTDGIQRLKMRGRWRVEVYRVRLVGNVYLPLDAPLKMRFPIPNPRGLGRTARVTTRTTFDTLGDFFDEPEQTPRARVVEAVATAHGSSRAEAELEEQPFGWGRRRGRDAEEALREGLAVTPPRI